MGDGRTAVLVRTDLRRAGPELRRKLVLLVFGAVVIVALDGWRSPFMTLLLGGVGLSYALKVPVDVTRDRVSGDLAFLTTLPVSAGTLVRAKFLTSALLCLVGALHWPLALLADPPGSWDPTGMGVLASVPWIWLGMSVGSFVLIALLVRFDLEALTSGPFAAAVVGLVLLSTVVDRWRPALPDRVESLVAQPWFGTAARGGALVVGLLLSVVAFRVAVRGLERYRPDPDAGRARTPIGRLRGR